MDEICRDGTLNLLQVADGLDTIAQSVKAKNVAEPCDKVTEYLDKSFLGNYFVFRKKTPIYLHNATNLFTYIRFLESEKTDILHVAYLKLLAYLSFVEIDDPLILLGNCLEFIETGSTTFDFNIYENKHSARQKYNTLVESLQKLKKVKTKLTGRLSAFDKMVFELDRIFDRNLRNSIAHCAYRIERDSKLVITKDKPYHFDEIDAYYINAYSSLEGFREAVTRFAEGIVPSCPYVLDWGPRW